MAQHAQSDGWTRYWSQGHAHSCPSSFTGYYGPATQAFWRERAAELTAQQKLLELGCGNGALLAFLADCCGPGQLPTCLGVDAAALDKDKLVTRSVSANLRERIAIRDRTLFSALPCAASSIDVLVSQYGFEYARDEASWAELDRVLRPRAQVHLLLHKRAGLLDRIAADEAEICTAALAAAGVMNCAIDMLPYVAQSHTQEGRQQLAGDPAATSARSRFNQASEALQAQAARLTHGGYAQELLHALIAILQAARPGSIDAAEQRLRALRDATGDHLGRLQALQDAALADTDIAALVSHLQDRGFGVQSPGIIREQGEEFAWSLTARRSLHD